MEKCLVNKSCITQVILMVIAIIGILDTIIILSISGNVDLGILFPMIFGICLIFLIIFKNTSIYRKNIKLYDRIDKILLGQFILWAISFVIVIVIVSTVAVSSMEVEVGAVIVLGAGLKGDEPSAVLTERLDNAVKYVEKYPAARIIVSGGQANGEIITEAEGMKRYLIRHGVPENTIIKEEKSTSTYENLIYSKQIYEDTYGDKLDEILIITNDFHMFRAKMLATRLGLKSYGVCSATPWYLYPNVYLREYIAIFKSLILDK